MKILENSSKRLVIYSRLMGIWILSSLFSIFGIVTVSSFLEITSFNCKKNEPNIVSCQTFALKTRHTQLVDIEVKKNEGVYQFKLTTTDQYLEWSSLVFLVFWMTISLYLFFKVIQTRVCIFDKNINKLIIETKKLSGKRLIEYPLNEIIDVVVSGGGFGFNGVPTEPVDVILSSGKTASVYISLDTNTPSKWYLKAQETVALIQSFLGLATDTNNTQNWLTNSSTIELQSCRIIYCMSYILAIGNIPIKYSEKRDEINIWGVPQIYSIGDIPVEYGKIGQLVFSKQITAIGDVCISYRQNFWQLRPCFDSIGDMAVTYSGRQIISIGDMAIQYDRAGRITAISNMSVQSDSYGKIVEIHSNSGFSFKQFVAIFLLVLSKNTNTDSSGNV